MKSSCRRGSARGLLIVFAILGLVGLWAPAPLASAQGTPLQRGELVTSTPGVPMVPKRVTIPLGTEPPVVNAESQRALAASSAQRSPPSREVPVAGTGDVGPLWPESKVQAPGSETGSAALLPGDFTVFRNTDVRDTANLLGVSTVNEPSADAAGDAVFYVGNWYAALSTDRGQSFAFVDPRGFPTVNGGFCCDQVVIYDRDHDLMFWLLQYAHDGTTNTQRVAVARGQDLTPDRSATAWSYLDYTPQSFGLPTNRWLDYPRMALTAEHLWITSNVFDMATPGASWTNSVAWRLSLDDLDAGDPVHWGWFTTTDVASLMPVLGATTTMYLGSHVSTSTLRLFTWPDSSGSITANDLSHGEYPRSNRGDFSCPVQEPGGGPTYDTCAFLDGRILGGWVANNVIGFMWTAAQGTVGSTTFNFPYIEAVRYNQSTLGLIDQPRIWNANIAFIYPAIAPNARGHIAGPFFEVGNGHYPTLDLMIWDDFTSGTWVLYGARAGTNGPSGNRWGDYVTSRRQADYPNTWISTGFTQQGGSANGDSWPQFLWFGRERDAPPRTPANDDFNSPEVVQSMGVQWWDTTRATTAMDDPITPSGCGSESSRQSDSVWFRFTPSRNGQYMISTQGSDYDTVVAVWTGARGSLANLGCDDDSGPNATSLLTINLNAYTTYHIEVMSYGATGGGTLQFGISSVSPPAAPSNLGAHATTKSQINLTWRDNSSDESGFRIERRQDGSATWIEIDTVNANISVYSDFGLECDTTYHYRVRAYRDSDGQYSEYSNTDSATTMACTAPTHTPTPTRTPTRTHTPTPTRTSTGTRTPTPTRTMGPPPSGLRKLYLPIVLKLRKPGKRLVLFDEAHEEANTLSWERAQIIEPEHPDWVYFGMLSAALSDEFTLVRSPDAQLTSQLLAKYDALMLSAPGEQLSADELVAVEQYLSNGGGVLIVCDPGRHWVVNPLTSSKGVTFDPDLIFEFGPNGDFEVVNFAAHPAVNGVTRAVTNWGASLGVTHPAVGLAFTQDNVFRDLNGNLAYDLGEPTGPFTIAAAYESGAARLVGVSDNPFQDSGFEWRNNAPFVRALLRWLTAPRAS
jgi:hypothetical protein